MGGVDSVDGTTDGPLDILPPPHLAPPPMEVMLDHSYSDSDDSMAWPPPPPPEDMEYPDDPDLHQGALLQRPTSIGSISDTHSNIMDTLNAKLSVRQSLAYDSQNIRTCSQEDVSNHGGMMHSQSSEDITPTAEPTDSLVRQIESGIKLRKATSNDRSAPNIP